MFRRLWSALSYKRGYIIGVHPGCPKCYRSYKHAEELDRAEYKKRKEVYLVCECGQYYRYHLGM